MAAFIYSEFELEYKMTATATSTSKTTAISVWDDMKEQLAAQSVDIYLEEEGNPNVSRALSERQTFGLDGRLFQLSDICWRFYYAYDIDEEYVAEAILGTLEDFGIYGVSLY